MNAFSILGNSCYGEERGQEAFLVERCLADLPRPDKPHDGEHHQGPRRIGRVALVIIPLFWEAALQVSSLISRQPSAARASLRLQAEERGQERMALS